MSEDAVDTLSLTHLLKADRLAVLGFLSAAIHAVTVDARAVSGERDAVERLLAQNEIVHRLSGHLRDLCAADEPLSESRAQAIVGLVQCISQRLRTQVQARVASGRGENLVDCRDVRTTEEFWQVYLDAVRPTVPGFGRNLDAFWDAIDRDGPGAPGGPVRFINMEGVAQIRNGDFLSSLQEIARESTGHKVTVESPEPRRP